MGYVRMLQAVCLVLALLLASCGGLDTGTSETGEGEATLEPSSGSTPGAAGSGSTPGAPGSGCTPVAAALETLTVSNQYGPIEGTLEVPAGCGKMPVVLIVSGSGPQDRDGNPPGLLFHTNVYRLLARGLRDAGFAVLRYDDLGTAKSAQAIPALESEMTYELEIDAAEKWVQRLHADSRFGQVIVAGHSQGSLTAILLEQRGGVDAVISLAGAGRPIDEVIREQLKPKLTATQLAQLDAVIAALKNGVVAGPQAPPLDKVFPVSAQPYFISWMKYDPKAEIGKVTSPTMLVQGKTDLQVSVADALLLSAGKPDAQLRFITFMCHPLKRAFIKNQLFQLRQYLDPTMPLHPALVPALTAFLDTEL